MVKEKTESEKRQYYQHIGERSFKTVFDQYLFYRFSRGKQSDICLDDFKTFKVNLEIIDEYVNEYWQKEYVFKKPEWNNTLEEIGNKIYDWEKRKECESVINECKEYYVSKRFEKVYPEEQFIKLLQKKTCEYCDITEEMVKDLISKHKIFKKKLTRGWTLEIDRKKPNLEYTEKNCVRCCYWCNSAKTDEFNEIEFKPIGEAIKNIWNDRLNR